MTTNEELERVVERAMKKRDHPSSDTLGFTTLATADFDTIMKALTERAELLAAVERMRGALESAAETLDHVDGALMVMGEAGAVPAVGTWRFVTQAAKRARARAALTTGEANHKYKP